MRALKEIISLFLICSVPAISTSMQEPMVIEEPMMVEQPTVKLQFKDIEVDYPVAEYAKVIRRSQTLQFFIDPDESINFATISDAELEKKILEQSEQGVNEVTYETFKAINNAITTDRVTETDTQKLCDLINAANFLDIEILRDTALKRLSVKAFFSDLDKISDEAFFNNYCTYSLPEDLQQYIINFGLKDIINEIEPKIVKNFKYQRIINNAKISPDHSFMAVGFSGYSKHGELGKIVNLKTYKANSLYQTTAFCGFVEVAISPDNRLIATGHDSINLWDAKTKKLIAEKKLEKNYIKDLTFTPDGKNLAVQYPNDDVEIFSLQNFPEKIVYKHNFSSQLRRPPIRDLVIGINTQNIGNYYLLFGSNRDAYLFSTHSENPIFVYPTDVSTFAVAISHNAKFLITGDTAGWLKIWNPPSERPQAMNFTDAIYSLALSANLKYLIVATTKDVYILTLKGQFKRRKLSFALPIQNVDISLDNHLLIATRKEIQILDLERADVANFLNNLALAEAQLWKLKTKYNLTEQQIPNHLKPVYESLQEKIKKFKAEALGKQ